MLPVPYFHVTVTVPAELREVLRAHQRDGYAVLMQASAAAIIELARDPRYVGGTVARARRAAHLDAAVELAPARSLPGQWRRDLRGRHHLASGAAELPGAHQGSRQIWCAASSGPSCAESVPISSSRTPCGVSAGSSTSPPGATANRPCSTTSPATSFASLSPTPASSVSTTKQSASDTGNARPADREPAVSAAMSSCAASFSMCCRAASTRSVTSACGIPRNATMPPGSGRCCNSRHHRGSTRRWTASFRRPCHRPRSQRHRSSR